MICTCHSKLSVKIPNLTGFAMHHACQKACQFTISQTDFALCHPPQELHLTLILITRVTLIHMSAQSYTHVPPCHQYFTSIAKERSDQAGLATHTPIAELAATTGVPWEQC